MGSSITLSFKLLPLFLNKVILILTSKVQVQVLVYLCLSKHQETVYCKLIKTAGIAQQIVEYVSKVAEDDG